jgi:NTP pyrophosphatase (non-canonical NTP hydrolase)
MAKDHEELKISLRQFAAERDWDQFHSPKNLAAALAVEAAEVLEHFQWVTEEGSRSLPEAKVSEVAQELADVFLYLLQLSDKLGIDLIAAGRAKLATNAGKYPVDRAKGSSRKYTEF